MNKLHAVLVFVLGTMLAGLMILDYRAKSITPPVNAAPLLKAVPVPPAPLPPAPVPPPPPAPPKKNADKTADEVMAPFFKDASEKNRHVLLFLSRDGCVPCSRLERTLDRNTDDMYKFYLIKAKDPRLNDKYRVTAFPTLVVLDKTGKELGRQVGYLGDTELHRFLQPIPVPPKDPAVKQ